MDQLYSRHAKTPDFEREKDIYREAGRLIVDAPGAVLGFLVNAARDLTHAGSIGINMVDGLHSRQIQLAGRYQVLSERFGTRLSGFAAEDGLEPCPHLYADPAQTHPQLGEFDETASEMLIVPLVDRQGQALGSLWAVHHIEANKFDANDARVLSEVADLVQSTFALLIADAGKLSAGEGLRSSLLHQQVLTSEASHRVKNSLQLVSSLLTMQMVSSDDETLKRGLSDAQRRIMAIAQVHDRLWRTQNIDNVDLSRLVSELGQALQQTAPTYTLQVSVGTVSGSPDLGNSLALIINELVTNAFKYAYPASRQGIITVALEDDGRDVVLEIADRGVGFAQGAEPAKSRTLGMRLVHSLVHQLQGTIVIDGKDGARFTIRIPHGS